MTKDDIKVKKIDDKKKKKRVNKEVVKTISFVLVIIAVISIIGYLCFLVIGNGNSNKPQETVKKNLNEIAGYGITLDDLDSELYKELFTELKKNLEGKEINYKEYAKSVAKMYIVDLYSINNKLNKYDISTELIWPTIAENYRTQVMDTLYLYVEDNSRKQRDQNLPEVKSIEVDSIKETKYIYNNGTDKDTKDDVTYEAYEIELNWTYRIKYGYDTQATIIVIKDNDKLYVAEQKA